MENNARKKTDIVTDHAWKGAWNRPMKIDERGLHPFTIARMTDHNVRGPDDGDDERKDEEMPEASGEKPEDLNDPWEADPAA